MAGNRTRIYGKKLMLTLSDGGVNAGDPCLVGAALTGVVESPKDANGNAVVLREGVFSLSVKGVTNGAVNSAVVQGDKLFYSSTHTPRIDKDTTGVFFGYAKGAQPTPPTAVANPLIAAGATATIEVILAGGSAS